MKKQPKSWLVFFSLGFQIGIVMYAAIMLGRFLDIKFDTSTPWFTLALCVFAMIAILKLIITQTRKL